MKSFKEWLSDNLRYVMLGFAVILVIVILVLGFKLLKPYLGDAPKESNKLTESNLSQSTDKATDKTTEKKTDKKTEKKTDKTTEKASETEKGTDKTEKQETETQKRETDKMGQTLKQPETKDSADSQGGSSNTGTSETEAPDIVETPVIPAPETQAAEKPAAPPVSSNMTINHDVYIRDAPNYDSSILATLPEGQVVTFLEDAGGWYKVDANGLVGYVGARFLY